MKKSLIVLFAAFSSLSIFTSCGPPSNYGPNDIVTISGKFIDPDGNPYADKQVGVWVLDIQGISYNNYWYPDPDDYELTESDGTFKIRQKGDRYLWPNGTAKYVLIANIDSLAGPVTAMGFFVINQETTLPDAKLWLANVNSTVTNDTAAFTWDAVDAVAGQAPDKYAFSSAVVYWDLWSEDSVASGFKMPAYPFQNSCNAWRIAANIARPDDNGIDWSFMSETKAGANLIPSSAPSLLSKGKAAYAAGHGDTNYTKLTNQVWHEWEAFNNTYPAWVMLDLGESKTVSAAVMYGLLTNYTNANQKQFDNFEIYVAEDTTNWGSPVSTNEKESGYIRFDFDPVTGRYVKFKANEGANIRIAWIREFAAFGQ